MKSLIAHKGKVYRAVERPGMMSGYVETTVPDADPFSYWAGGKIPIEQWHQILNSFLWSNSTFKCESLVRGFYNPENRAWMFTMLPQEKGGMTVREIESDARRAIVAQLLGAGYHEYFSAHHHCGASAFQSSTDTADETKREGLHITIGDMNRDKFSIHSRVNLSDGNDTVFYDAILSDWFCLSPEDMARLEALGLEDDSDFMDAIIKRRLTSKPPEGTAFPESWKQMLVEPIRVVNAGGYMGQGFFGGAGSGSSVSTGVSRHGNFTDSAKKLLEWMIEQAICTGITESQFDKYIEGIDLLEDARESRTTPWASSTDVVGYYRLHPNMFNQVQNAVINEASSVKKPKRIGVASVREWPHHPLSDEHMTMAGHPNDFYSEV
jgi:hypothetical protein